MFYLRLCFHFCAEINSQARHEVRICGFKNNTNTSFYSRFFHVLTRSKTITTQVLKTQPINFHVSRMYKFV